jgi:hypothetical protein
MRVVTWTLLLSLAAAATARAQAFVPPKGDAFASVVFTNMFVENHFLPDRRVDVGHIDTNAMLFDLTYGLTDRMAVTVGIPLVVSRYQGAFPHQATNPDAPDNTGWNSTFSDFRFNVRYNMLRGPVAITPYFGSLVPSHAYDYVAHAAPGKNLREFQIGVAAAGLLDRFVSGMFVQGRYGFAVVEETVGIRPNYSSGDIEVGYFINPSVRVFGMAAGRYSHDGIDLPIPPIARVVLPPDQFVNHDQIVREHFLNLSVGTSVSISESVDLFGAFMKQVTGRNTHEVSRAISVGMSWAFKRRRIDDPVTNAAPAPAPPAPVSASRGAERGLEPAAAKRSLLRCLCQKTG